MHHATWFQVQVACNLISGCMMGNVGSSVFWVWPIFSNVILKRHSADLRSVHSSWGARLSLRKQLYNVTKLVMWFVLMCENILEWCHCDVIRVILGWAWDVANICSLLNTNWGYGVWKKFAFERQLDIKLHYGKCRTQCQSLSYMLKSF